MLSTRHLSHYGVQSLVTKTSVQHQVCEWNDVNSQCLKYTYLMKQNKQNKKISKQQQTNKEQKKKETRGGGGGATCSKNLIIICYIHLN